MNSNIAQPLFMHARRPMHLSAPTPNNFQHYLAFPTSTVDELQPNPTPPSSTSLTPDASFGLSASQHLSSAASPFPHPTSMNSNRTLEPPIPSFRSRRSGAPSSVNISQYPSATHSAPDAQCVLSVSAPQTTSQHYLAFPTSTVDEQQPSPRPPLPIPSFSTSRRSGASFSVNVSQCPSATPNATRADQDHRKYIPPPPSMNPATTHPKSSLTLSPSRPPTAQQSNNPKPFPAHQQARLQPVSKTASI
ncbi:hypothetical protein DFH07DRAFT_828898 [Mycena maculata]|uniref:Uncharacterized protein n=1 Tax=Mycena maculata TaxID=230809 RepID=A0AAD7ISI4_9AGAR|nr:hypothetical protein DFH07DRAFT_828898 [Mycena maculata]